MMSDCYEIIGATASPFSFKLRAALRYRHIPHLWKLRHISMEQELAEIKPPVMPFLRHPDGTLSNDTTPLIYQLEKDFINGRQVVPDDPALAFISHLVEDMADEWGTRIMAFYRWNFSEDQALIGGWVANEMFAGQPEEKLEKVAEGFRQRQRDRMDVIGCHADNRDIVAHTFHKTLKALADISISPGFCFGSRPGLADFAWYGQYMQSALEHTAGNIIKQEHPAVFPWLLKLDDASGVEGAWIEDLSQLPQGTLDLLRLAVDFYLPYLIENATGVRANQDLMMWSYEGMDLRQQPSKYQAKCLRWLSEEWQVMQEDDKQRILALAGLSKIAAYLES